MLIIIFSFLLLSGFSSYYSFVEICGDRNGMFFALAEKGYPIIKWGTPLVVHVVLLDSLLLFRLHQNLHLILLLDQALEAFFDDVIEGDAFGDEFVC